MRTLARSAFSIGAAAALLAGCRGPQLSIDAPGVVTQSLPQHTEIGQTPSGAPGYLQLYSFTDSASGAWPAAQLTYLKGKLYGTATAGSGSYGTVFSMTSFGRVRVLHHFSGKPSDGAYPVGGLAVMNGALYGTTYYGGQYDAGTVFSITTAGQERILHSFTGRDGQYPLSSLLPIGGVLYGTTEDGGRYGKGTVFAVTASGSERVVHEFRGAPRDGGHPGAGLIAVKKWLYGTTLAGGQIKAGGTIYRVNALGQEKVLHAFGVSAGDGQNPHGLLLYYGGVLFGTTLVGGAQHLGTVFEMNTGGQETVQHSFGQGTDGAYPESGLVAAHGNLYGTTKGGGYNRPSYCSATPSSSQCGIIYRVDRLGREHVVYRFKGYPDGANPYAPLTNVAGALYGATYSGGSSEYFGTIFKLIP